MRYAQLINDDAGLVTIACFEIDAESEPPATWHRIASMAVPVATPEAGGAALAMFSALGGMIETEGEVWGS